MIRPEDVADLQPGDVVELTFPQEYDSTPIAMRGTYPAVWNFYDNYLGNGNVTLTVISRVPRPLYVNHSRGHRASGDCACDDADAENPLRVWWNTPDGWLDRVGRLYRDSELPARLRLLIDGETGQVVQ